VDNAFKKRKEENEVLAIAVADLENHLTYLENQTQDQITATTALNLALASTQKNVNDVSDAVQDVSAKALEELNERLLQLSAAAEQGELTQLDVGENDQNANYCPKPHCHSGSFGWGDAI
jgi:hypothetical protein